EAIWDAALRASIRFAPVAVDDMHRLEATPDEPVSGPGRGWVEIFTPELTRTAICDDLGHGRLIASSGARVRRLHVDNETFELELDEDDASVEFFGNAGLLSTQRVTRGAGASYRLRDREWYVRARVTTIDGRRAWTTAYRTVW